MCSLLTLWLSLHASERRNMVNPTRVNGAHGATLTAWGCSGVQYQWRFGDAQLHHNVNRLTGGRLRYARAIPPPLQPFAPARLCSCTHPCPHPRSVPFYPFCVCCEATKSSVLESFNSLQLQNKKLPHRTLSLPLAISTEQ